jgi:polar amino acid transport system substrate-binding protein
MILARLFKALLIVCLFMPWLVFGQSTLLAGPAAKLDSLLNQERSLGCDKKNTDRLQEILCNKVIKIGVNDSLQGFGDLVDKTYVGFEIDLASEIAKLLGVKIQFVPVVFESRFRFLLEGQVDLVLANMTHTEEREQIIDFVRPPYYSSPTAVVGKKNLTVKSFEDIGTQSVCVQTGAYSNKVFSQNNIRMLMYESPGQLFGALKFGACDFVAYDRPILQIGVLGEQAPPELRNAYEEKFSFDEGPWGIGVEKSKGKNLRKAVSLIIAGLHGSGHMMSMAQTHGVLNSFLKEQNMTWSSPACYQPSGDLLPECFVPPFYAPNTKSFLAPYIEKIQAVTQRLFGWKPSLLVFSDKDSLSMMGSGLINSLILLLAAQLTTALFCIVFFKLITSKRLVVHYASKATAIFLLNAPTLFILILGYLLASSVTAYSGALALGMAAVVIGLGEGATGGYALYEASKTIGLKARLLPSLKVARVRVRACLITAAQCCPIAAFIGAPELLSSMTDITAFTGERVTTLTLLALFYGLAVQVIIVITGRIFDRLNPVGHKHAR